MRTKHKGRIAGDNWMVWTCNYKEGCNKPSYYHLCTDGRHKYICPKHLKEYLGIIRGPL